MTKTKKISWIKHSRKTRKIKLKKNNAQHPVIKKFKVMLEKYPVEKQYMNTMISSIPKSKKEKSQKPPTSLDDLFEKLNNVLVTAPEFNKTALVGTPMSSILLLTMGSPRCPTGL